MCTIKPVVNADGCFAESTVYLYYGEYTIPADTPKGFYEARLVDSTGVKSLPYWSKVEVY